ncbi:hypothetical protein PAECIP111891_06030 [Paenibacillus allorhizoplanae]|uniref:Extracellular solute-binding protein n=1 Tax=Paenibacillus allorhizoplanae TaxID=2905648 RepID=A0ABM9CWG3_9BACL|nr:extracellular solute-binding protein [Paenibacillus allorhizoplanae]CAH1226924.1 hypothetical protein PAECIP111891_06030 [Paenibacillus allorhizoplanae]
MNRKWKTGMVSLLMPLVVIAGCSTKEGTTEPTATGAGATAKASKKYKIELFQQNAGSVTLPPADQDFVKKAIDEKLNIDLKITFMPAGPDYTNKLNVRFASGDVPDLFTIGGREIQTYANNGSLTHLADYLNDKYLPNYLKWADAPLLKAERDKNNPMGFWAMRPYAKTEYSTWYIRKDWLDKLGLKVPTNNDELLNVMRAFTFKDPDGNGKQDTYGFTATGNGEQVGQEWPMWAKYGMMGTFTNDGKHVKDNLVSPETGKVLAEIKAVIDEKIVDPDWFLNKGEAVFEKFAQGKVGIVNSRGINNFLEGNPNSFLNKGKKINPKFDIVAFNPYPDQATWVEATGNTGWAIPKAVADKDPDKVLRILQLVDYLCSEEGYLLTHYGKQDVHYKRDGNKILPNMVELDKIAKEQGDFLKIYGAFSPTESEARQIGLDIVNPNLTDRDRELYKQLATYKRAPYSNGIQVTPPDGINIADFRKQQNVFHTKIVFGEIPIEKWPQLSDELMNKYRGKEIFANYEKQMREAGVLE